MVLRRRKRGGRGLEQTAMPSLTSLMDIITIILVYLIKTFAASPIEVANPTVTLPISSSVENVEDLVVVMITGAQRREIGPDGKAMYLPEVPTVLVDDDVILLLSENFEVPADQLERQFIIRPLRQKLLEMRKMQGVTAELTDQGGFNRKIVFVIDKNVPYRSLSQFLVTSAEAGYDEFKFAIVKREG